MTGYLRKIKDLFLTNSGISYVSLSNITGNAIGSIFWIILATMVTTDIYGKVSYFLAIGNFAAVIVAMGSPIFLTAFIAKGLSKVDREIVSLVLILSLIAALGLFIVFHYLPLSLLVVGMVFYVMSFADMIGRGDYRKYAIGIIIQKVVNLVLPLVLYLAIGFDGIIFGLAISYLIFGYRSIFALRYFKLSFPLLKEKKKFLFDSWGLDISKSIGFVIDKFLIAPLFGFAILGIYQLGIQFFMLQSVIPNIIFSYLLREEASGINRRYIKIFGIIITLALSVIITIFSPYVVPILFPKFIDSIPLIQIVTWGAPLMIFNSIFTSELLAKERSRPVLLSAAIFTVLLYASMYYLGNLLGTVGLVYGLLIALGSETVCLYLFRRKILSKTNGNNM